jgi:hypothetical protein
MRPFPIGHRIIGLAAICLIGMVPAALAAEPDRNALAERVTKLSHGTQWKPVKAVTSWRITLQGQTSGQSSA